MLQIINYRHNIRGWLTDINDAADLQDDLFAFHINYNQAGTDYGTDYTQEKLYNGNISDPSPEGERSEAKPTGARPAITCCGNTAISMTR